jgi:phage/plasmid-associated DNA primase
VATYEYRLDADNVSRFCDEMLEFTRNPADREDRAIVYRAYEEWAHSSGEKPVSRKALAEELKVRGAVPDPRNVRIPIQNRDTGAVEGYRFVRLWREVRFQASVVGGA